MDAEIIYSLFGIVGFIIVIALTLRSGKDGNTQVKTKKQKKKEIIAEYQAKLEVALADFSNNKERRIAMKTTLLKEYSNELSRNIFFDDSEVKEIILELSLN